MNSMTFIFIVEYDLKYSSVGIRLIEMGVINFKLDEIISRLRKPL